MSVTLVIYINKIIDFIIKLKNTRKILNFKHEF